jgi:antitoxin HicB
VVSEWGRHEYGESRSNRSYGYRSPAEFLRNRSVIDATVWATGEGTPRVRWKPSGVRGRSIRHASGSGIDDFLKEEGIFEEAQAQSVKEIVAWQLAEPMKKQKISKNKLATLLKTSRPQVDRILDPKNDITLGSLQRAAAMVGRRVTIELV